MRNTVRVKPAWLGVIPATLRHSSAVSPQAKVLFAELTALCNDGGWTTASNAMLAGFLGTTATRVANGVQELFMAGFLAITHSEPDPGTGRSMRRSLCPLLTSEKSLEPVCDGFAVACTADGEAVAGSGVREASRPPREQASPSGASPRLRSSPLLRFPKGKLSPGTGPLLPKGAQAYTGNGFAVPEAHPHTRKTSRLIIEWNTIAASCNLEPADPKDPKLTRSLLRRTSDEEHPNAAFWRELFDLVRQTTRFHGTGWLSLEWIVRNADAPIKLKRMARMWSSRGVAPQNTLLDASVNAELAAKSQSNAAIKLKPRRNADESADRLRHLPGSSGKALKGWDRTDL